MRELAGEGGVKRRTRRMWKGTLEGLEPPRLNPRPWEETRPKTRKRQRQ